MNCLLFLKFPLNDISEKYTAFYLHNLLIQIDYINLENIFKVKVKKVYDAQVKKDRKAAALDRIKEKM